MDLNFRRAAFKKVIDSSDARKGRAQVNNDVRKNKLMEAHMKRRNVALPQGTEGVTPPPTPQFTNGLTVVPPPKASDTALIANYVAEMMTENADAQFHGTQEIRKLLSKERDPPVLAVLHSGVLPRLLHFLASGNEKMQFEAAWAVTNIASTEYTYAVVEAGGIAILASLLRSSSPEVREQCAWCLGNITGDGPKFRDMVLSTPGAVEALMLNIQFPHNESLLKNVTWTLSNFCRGKPQPPLEVVLPMIPAFVHLLGANDAEILADACWGLSYITDGDEARIQAVIDAQAVPRLVAMLGHSSTNVVVPALRAIGNIVTGNDVQTQCVIDAGALVAFTALTRHERRNIRREACWAASNVAAGTPAQVAQVVATPGLIQSLIQQADKGEWNVRKEAAWAVSNAITTGGPQVVLAIVSVNVIPTLIRLLSVEDPKILMVAMEALHTILGTDNPSSAQTHAMCVEEVGGVLALEELQKHTAKEVYNKALEILDEYFSEEDEEGENAVQTDTSGKTFMFGSGFGQQQPTQGQLAFGQQPQVNTGFNFGFLAQQPAFTSA